MTESVSAKALFEISISRWKNREFDAARSAADELIRAYPDDQEAVRLYAQLFFFQFGDRDQALNVLTEALERRQHSLILNELCRFLILEGKFVDVKRLVSKFFRTKKLAGAAYMNFATAILLAENDLNAAAGFYNRASVIGGVDHVHEVASRMVLSPEAFVYLGQYEMRSELNGIHFVETELVDYDVIFATSGDEKYFYAFYDIYWKSFRATNARAGVILHFHVFNPSQQSIKNFENIQKDDASLRFSYEFVSHENPKYYYAGRFIQMPRLLSHYNTQIYVTDIDCVYIGSVDDMIEKNREFDLAIYRYDRYSHPWECFRANMVMFSNSDAGKKFAKCVSNFLGLIPDVNFNYWYVDQLSLAMCYYSNEYCNIGRISSLNDQYNKICYQPTGASGHPDEKALRAVRELSIRNIKWNVE